MPKRLNPNLAKMHRNYTVEEVASLFGVHKNSVRAWIKAGLPVCDARRPVLILGLDLRDYLTGKRRERKRRCGADELYCLRCREPRSPAEGMVDYIPMTAATGRLNALCPVCTAVMNRYVGAKGLDKIRVKLDVRVPRSQRHISKRNVEIIRRVNEGERRRAVASSMELKIGIVNSVMAAYRVWGEAR